MIMKIVITTANKVLRVRETVTGLKVCVSEETPKDKIRSLAEIVLKKAIMQKYGLEKGQQKIAFHWDKYSAGIRKAIESIKPARTPIAKQRNTKQAQVINQVRAPIKKEVAMLVSEALHG